MKIVKNLLFWVSTVCLVIMILAVTIPKLFGVEFRAVVSGSMTPDIPVGSLVIIVPEKPENIKVGDDITFVSSGDIVVTHRVVSVDREKNEFMTRGIANSQDAIDPPNRYENIIGVVRMHIPKAGQAFSWLSGPEGKVFKILFATFLVAAFILSNIFGVWMKDKKTSDSGEDEEVEDHILEKISGSEKSHRPIKIIDDDDDDEDYVEDDFGSEDRFDKLMNSFKESEKLFTEEEIISAQAEEKGLLGDYIEKTENEYETASFMNEEILEEKDEQELVPELEYLRDLERDNGSVEDEI